ncbi:hypothetical protein PR002_g9907 [Phytophthora rubi]|uniref:Cation efflux protein transmembrane domain-containing protein n=1 Tax=Phytophthora rubi TaxID=129364 RepID=A0A6A3MM14_9STRA|nr:hypothetical protein PR002_g9907 [Phytophthora rubi]
MFGVPLLDPVAGMAVAAMIVKTGGEICLDSVQELTHSKVLIANAWHHRTDAISSVVALGGIVGSMFGVPLLDPVAGMAVAAMIVKTGGEICLDRYDLFLWMDTMKTILLICGTCARCRNVVNVSDPI